MAKFELSLSPDYVPHWNLQDALRELFQNAVDQETTHLQNEFSFLYTPDGGTLSIANKTSHLDKSTLLLGTSSKRESTVKTVGKFGEGYKIAALVLTRLGKTFRIYNNDETWSFRFSNSRRYNCPILVCEISNNSAWGAIKEAVGVHKVHTSNLIMCVDGITQDEYDELMTLNLHVKQPVATIHTECGRILLDPEYAGKLFVNGLFIIDTGASNGSTSRYLHGYDFNPSHIKLDRDRKLVSDGDIKWLVAKMWVCDEAQTSDPLNYKKLIKLLIDANAPDVEYCHYQSGAYYMANKVGVGDDIYKDFKEKHGANAIPVYCQSELEAVEHDKTVKPVMVSNVSSFVMRNSSSYNYVPPSKISTKEKLQSWLNKILCSEAAQLPATAVDEFHRILEEL